MTHPKFARSPYGIHPLPVVLPAIILCEYCNHISSIIVVVHVAIECLVHIA